jgi:hypothetical protein
MIIPSLVAGLAQLQALANFIDQGRGNATFVFYEDEKPTSTLIEPNESKKLVVLNLPNPSFKRMLLDGNELFPTSSEIVLKTGIAVWARLFSANGDVVADFQMGTDIILNNYELVMGSKQTLDSIILKPYLG